MPGPKTNERPGTRAIHRHARVSAYKVREVLDLIRNKPIGEAEEILRFSERDAAILVGKVLHSAVANASNNDSLDPEELYVAACFADEGTTIKRWRPRARGRATRIRKRTCHITVIVSRLPADRLERLAARRRADLVAQRARRVAGARRAEVTEGDTRSRAERRRRGGEAALQDHDEHDHDEHDHDEHDHDHEADDVSEAEVAAETDDEGAPDETAVASADVEDQVEEHTESEPTDVAGEAAAGQAEESGTDERSE